MFFGNSNSWISGPTSNDRTCKFSRFKLNLFQVYADFRAKSNKLVRVVHVKIGLINDLWYNKYSKGRTQKAYITLQDIHITFKRLWNFQNHKTLKIWKMRGLHANLTFCFLIDKKILKNYFKWRKIELLFRSGAPLWLTFGVRKDERVKVWKDGKV